MSQHDVTAQVRVIVFVNGLWHWHFLAEHVVEIGHGRVFAGAGGGGVFSVLSIVRKTAVLGLMMNLLCGFGSKNGKEESDEALTHCIK